MKLLYSVLSSPRSAAAITRATPPRCAAPRCTERRRAADAAAGHHVLRLRDRRRHHTRRRHRRVRGPVDRRRAGDQGRHRDRRDRGTDRRRRSVGRLVSASRDRRLTAMHDHPIDAAVYDGTAWHDLRDPYPTGCDSTRRRVGHQRRRHGRRRLSVERLQPGARSAGRAATPRRRCSTCSAPPSPAPCPTNRATVVSDDGTVAAGLRREPRARSLARDLDRRRPRLPDRSDRSGRARRGAIDQRRWLARRRHLGERGLRVDARRPGAPRSRSSTRSLPGSPVFPNAMTGDGSARVRRHRRRVLGRSRRRSCGRTRRVRATSPTLARTGRHRDPRRHDPRQRARRERRRHRADRHRDVDVNGAGGSKTFVLRLPASAL